MAAKLVTKSPVNPEVLNEVLQGVGAGGFNMRVSDGEPIVIESEEITQEVLEWAVTQAKGRKSKTQLDAELRTTLLAKQTWTNAERDQALRLLLERMVI